ncbi:hypothetical protein L486_00360 [Kwoniella mangroviensis CBS 10435]|uniref:Uncharacterized protein n=1 Tax=Kwoniella mangroviensis CBS 10435 TaxID=1331196 RepID=A0A1B9IYW0_9TREE|nr:hypothetical protein L486_00360 [Kwoniella mangroviensis CBS 10435]
MSLGVSSSSSSPLTNHPRPLAPNRRRTSHMPSPRATPRLTPESSFVESTESAMLASPSVKELDGTMGGLRERSEEELARAGREELEDALRREWEDKENASTLSYTNSVDWNSMKSLEEKHEELVKGISALQSKTDEAFNEQTRMEADLEERDELLDRLRKRLTEAERLARESQKRYIEQEQTFDIERQALQAQENHLQQRIKTLSNCKSSRSTTPVPEVENIASLKDELASINLSHSTLLAKLNTLTKELHELKILNEELQEENEGWEFLIRERTMNGKLMEKGGILSNHLAQDPANDRNEEGIDSELEEEMSELNSDLENQSPIFDDDHQFFATDLGHTDTNDFLAPPKHSRRGGRGGRNRTASHSSRNEGDKGMDLASELSMVDDDKSDAGQSIASANGRNAEVIALRAEIKQLKESNKALTLYCSKIIDRIITQEGFEHVLSVDYKTRRAGTRSASTSSRPALKDVNGGSWGMPSASSPISEEPPTIVKPQTEAVKEKKARPLSMMVRAMTGPAEKTVVPPVTGGTPAVPDEIKSEKRARRGFSLDFRSLGFGTSSYTAPTESSKTSLRPLTLSSKSGTTTGSRSSSSTARKLEIHEEDEEDRKERHRMEATLKLMGINKSTPPPGSIPEQDEEEGEGEFPMSRASFRASSGRSSTSSQSHSHRSTPLGRLSSVLGPNEVDNEFPIPMESIENPDQAIEVLRAFDEKQNERLKEMSKGKRSSMYTSPPKIHSRRISIEEKDRDQEMRDRTISKSESIKTLWSLGGGGDSRPNSGEIVIEKK